MKTKFKYFKCMCYPRRRIRKMHEQGELDDKMYSNLIATFNRFRIYATIIIIANIGSYLSFYVNATVLILLILVEIYFGTKGMK